MIDEAINIYSKPGIDGKWNDKWKRFRFPSGAVILFGYLEKADDHRKYQGKPYAYIRFDEVTHIRPESYLYLIGSRLRSTNPEVVKRTRCTGNPDGPYVLFYHDRFVKKLKPGETKWFDGADDNEVDPPKTLKDPGVSRYWVNCIRSENPYLAIKDPSYENRLNMLPEDQRDALKHGLWIFNDDPQCLIKSSWIAKARSGQVDPKNGHFSLGYDFAYLGADKTVMVKGYGNRVTEIRSWPKTEHTFAAETLFKEMSAHGFQMNCAMDANGIGAGVYSILKLPRYKDIFDRIIPLAKKDLAFDEAAKIKYDKRIKFLNIRSQIFWRLREDLERGDIDLSAVVKTRELVSLIQELGEVHWEMKNGFVKIEDKEEIKKRIKRSTDYLDAFAYWNWARHTPIDLPSVEDDYSEREFNEIDYGIYGEEDFDGRDTDKFGDGSNIGSWS